MGKVRTGLSISLDGFIGGPNDGPEAPMGHGGEWLLAWYSGDDYLLGGNGHDEVFGGPGKDKLYGGEGNDYLHGGSDDDEMWDLSKISNDTYSSLNGPSGFDKVADFGGGNDILDLPHLYRHQVQISWVDSQGDGKLDAVFIWQTGTTNYLLVYQYFDNKGGPGPLGRGVGVLETVKFKQGIVNQFPIPPG
jgi:Ca2+-binding RTX toxin-like protein